MSNSIAGWTRRSSCPDYVHPVSSRRRDLRFAAFVVALTLLEVTSLLVGPQLRWSAVGVTAASALVLLGVRSRPLVACVLAFALLTVEVALSPRATLMQFAGVLVTFAVAGAANDELDAVVAWAAGVGMLAYAAWGDPFGGGVGDWLLSVAFGTALWGAGLLVVRRGRRADLLLLRAQTAEAARERATSEERGRIARELHDVVSHGLTVAIVQTVAARGAAEAGNLADVQRRLEAVETTSREALAEMRRMLGLLELVSPTPEHGPGSTPRLKDLPALVARTCAAGVDVTLDAGDIAQTELPAGLELAAFRVVQEALTNVVKHAPGARARIDVGRVGSRLEVRIEDSGGGRATERGEGGGRGLVGMRQRAALYGGEVDAGPQAGGGFAVHASFAVGAGGQS